MKLSIHALFLLVCFSLFSCEDNENGNTLRVSAENIDIPSEGGSKSLNIETDASSWNIKNPAPDWIEISSTSGSKPEAIITIRVTTKTLKARSDTLTVTAGDAKPAKIVVSQPSSAFLYELTTNQTTLEFGVASGSVDMTIVSGAPEWELSCEANWLALTPNNGSEGEHDISVHVSENNESTERETTIKLSGEAAPTSEIRVTQKGREGYPSYNTHPLEPDMSGMSSTAMEIAEKIKIGWNLGNTLEAIGGETAWGNPKVTEELIKLVKQNGFNAIRIPCSWDQYVENSSTAKIKTEWLDRVKQIITWCVNNDLYVILNIHWDGGWLEGNCTPETQEEVNAKQKAFWEQIATHMRNFDEHLLFASANEPNVENSTQMDVLLSYHQTFIDAVRSTGGRNSYRVLVVQGPSTDIEKTNNLMKSMPGDEVEDRLMAEIHYYTPFQFCLMTEDANWGDMFYYWGKGYHSETMPERNATWGEEETMEDLMQKMNEKFVSQGIPVVLGEFAVIRRSHLSGENLDLHLASRAYYLKYLMQQAKDNGILPFYWDAGNMGENASALFDRNNNSIYDQQALDALMTGMGSE